MIETGFFNGDCMDYLREYPDKAFDLAIVDPPYGLLDAERRRTRKARG